MVRLASLAMGWALLSACGPSDAPPGNEDALNAVRHMLSQPSGAPVLAFAVAAVHVAQCVRQAEPAGYRCNVELFSAEMPVLGVVRLPMSLRFVARGGQWNAFVL